MPGLTFVEQNRTIESEQLYEDEDKPKRSTFSQFINSRRVRLTAFATVFALIVPVVLFYFMIQRPQVEAEDVRHTCAINTEFRIPCFDGNLTEEVCLGLNCCFDYDIEYCFHSLPSRYYYYRDRSTDAGQNGEEQTDCFVPNLSELNSDFFGSNLSLPTLNFKVEVLDENHIKVTIQNTDICNIDDSEQSIGTSSYYIETYNNTLGLDIFRDSGTLLLSTGLGPLIATERYYEWSFFMGSDLFGLDRLYFTGNETYKHVIYKNKDNHTTVPAFMAHIDGQYHGLLFEISGPVEFMILPSRLVSVRVLSGDDISFVLMTGPTPKDVQQQFYNYNSNYEIPPKWLLQPHMCRSGDGDLYSIINEYLSFKDNGGSAEYVSDCLHDNLYYMLYEIYENDTLRERDMLNDTLLQLREDNKFILTLYPQILDGSNLHTKAEELGLLYQYPNGTPNYIGSHLNHQVGFLDYNSEQDLSDFFDTVLNLFDWLDIDGYSLKDNWPVDETFEMERIAHIPYINETFLEAMSNTIPWNATTLTGRYHYENHNIYANQQVELLRDNMGANVTIWSSSYNYGMKAIPQMQHVNTTWMNFRRAIRKTLIHGLFSSPFISIPVCGSTTQFDPELHTILCSRWYITAATFPMFTINSDFPRRDHLSLPTGHSRNIALDALEKRKMLIPYYYGILNKEEPITRPMFYDFYNDNNTFTLEGQYMLGDSLVVAQPLTREARTVTVYLPGGNETVFYEFFGGERFDDVGNVTLSVVVESDWIMFLRGGKIIPLQTADDAYTLAVALGLDGTASGTLFFNTVAMEISATETYLILSNLLNVYEDLNCAAEANLPKTISEFRVYGINNSTFSTSAQEIDLCSYTDEQQIDFVIDS